MVAERDGRRGRLELSVEEVGEAELRLTDVTRFDVRVLAPDRSGVEGVRVYASFSTQLLSSKSYRSRTDERGLARFEVDGTDGEVLRKTGSVELHADLLTAELVAESLQLPPLREDAAEVEFLVPELGPLELRWNPAAPARPPTNFEVAAADSEPNPQRLISDGNRWRPRFDEGGVARHEFVEIGLSLEAAAVRASGDGFVFEGPRHPAEDRIVTLGPTDLAPVVHAWMHPQGDSAAPPDGRLAWRDQNRWRTTRISWKADPAGGFTAMLPRSYEAQEEVRFLIERETTRGLERTVQTAPNALTRGRHELGTFELALPPLSAAGILREESGAALAGWTVAVAKESWTASAEADPFVGARPIATTDAEGRFVLRGAGATDPLQLIVANWAESFEQAFTAELGDTEVRLTVAALLELEGRLVVDDPRLLEHLSLHWQTPRLERSGGYKVVHPDKHGRFRCTVRRGDPGVLLICASEGIRNPLKRIEDVELHPLDPRLLAIDLRGKLSLTRFEVRDPAGLPLGPVSVFDLTAGPDPEAPHFQPGPHLTSTRRDELDSHEVCLLLPKETDQPVERIQIRAMGHRPRLYELSEIGSTAVLDPLGDLLFEVVGVLPPSADPDSLRLRFRNGKHPLTVGGPPLPFQCLELGGERFAVEARDGATWRALQLRDSARTILPDGSGPQLQTARLTGEFRLSCLFSGSLKAS